ncbi:hypothetical protein DAEQUDRAFT_137750 [Daedalea quercina L-15889]|uniref:Uncharacterized protein n=1 Tax=Daedalea quercina L-15889 TaxID=1314783 RepID=A0A165RSQ6_9APHY|nr:hypothetical protein DAEQUDRAFT_137750 [Daedalea quercina L-15889]
MSTAAAPSEPPQMWLPASRPRTIHARDPSSLHSHPDLCAGSGRQGPVYPSRCDESKIARARAASTARRTTCVAERPAKSNSPANRPAARARARKHRTPRHRAWAWVWSREVLLRSAACSVGAGLSMISRSSRLHVRAPGDSSATTPRERSGRPVSPYVAAQPVRGHPIVPAHVFCPGGLDMNVRTRSQAPAATHGHVLPSLPSPLRVHHLTQRTSPRAPTKPMRKVDGSLHPPGEDDASLVADSVPPARARARQLALALTPPIVHPTQPSNRTAIPTRPGPRTPHMAYHSYFTIAARPPAILVKRTADARRAAPERLAGGRARGFARACPAAIAAAACARGHPAFPIPANASAGEALVRAAHHWLAGRVCSSSSSSSRRTRGGCARPPWSQIRARIPSRRPT